MAPAPLNFQADPQAPAKRCLELGWGRQLAGRHLSNRQNQPGIFPPSPIPQASTPASFTFSSSETHFEGLTIDIQVSKARPNL